MRGCGTARDEVRARARLDRHDWRVTEQAAEFDAFAHAFARYGDDAHGGGFAVDHADGGFVGDDARLPHAKQRLFPQHRLHFRQHDRTGQAIYSATKAALILLTEAVDAEGRDFNVRATAVCPGGLRTDFLGGSARFPQAPIAAYRSVREHEQRYRQLNQNQSGDPVKAARALMNLAESADLPGRIYLGVDSFAAIGRKLQAVADEAQAWRALSLSTHYED